MINGTYSHFPDWQYSKIKPLGREALAEADRWFLRVELEFPKPKAREEKDFWLRAVIYSLVPYRDRDWVPVALQILAIAHKTRLSVLQGFFEGVKA